MNAILSIDNINSLANFYNKLGVLNDELINKVKTSINNTLIIAAHIENNEITSIVTSDLINNNYYLSSIKFLEYNELELIEIMELLINEIKSTNLGLNIFYDNYPFNRSFDSVLIKTGFKYSFLNYISDRSNDSFDGFKMEFKINDRSEDVIEYLKENYKNTRELMNKYLGISDETDVVVNIDKTNVLVIRENNIVTGVARFGIVNENMFINSIYANSDIIYLELIKIIKSLTSRNIEIGVIPIRTDFIKLLNNNNFIIEHADYMISLEGMIV